MLHHLIWELLPTIPESAFEVPSINNGILKDNFTHLLPNGKTVLASGNKRPFQCCINLYITTPDCIDCPIWIYWIHIQSTCVCLSVYLTKYWGKDPDCDNIIYYVKLKKRNEERDMMMQWSLCQREETNEHLLISPCSYRMKWIDKFDIYSKKEECYYYNKLLMQNVFKYVLVVSQLFMWMNKKKVYTIIESFL